MRSLQFHLFLPFLRLLSLLWRICYAAEPAVSSALCIRIYSARFAYTINYSCCVSIVALAVPLASSVPHSPAHRRRLDIDVNVFTMIFLICLGRCCRCCAACAAGSGLIQITENGNGCDWIWLAMVWINAHENNQFSNNEGEDDSRNSLVLVNDNWQSAPSRSV